MSVTILKSQLCVSLFAFVLFCAADLRDDLQYGAVLRDPQQPGLLEVQTAVCPPPTAPPGRTSSLQLSQSFFAFAF